MTSLEAIFKATHENYLSGLVSPVRPSYIPPMACRDQYVADLNGQPGPVMLTRRPVKELPNGQAPVVLILESPHFDEFADLSSPVPANGTTGENICAHVTRVVGMLSGATAITYPRPLVLANAIQFQCSLAGHQGKAIPTKHHRTPMFNRLWADPAILADFHARLRSYLDDYPRFAADCPHGYIVINACTMGIASKAKRNMPEQLRVMVETSGIVPVAMTNHLRVRHPATWLKGVPVSPW